MHAVRRILATTAILGAALAALLVGPAPAQAEAPDPPCEWEAFGTHSTCDRLPLFGHDLRVACGDSLVGAPVGYVPILGPGGIELGRIGLLYQAGGPLRICRLAAAHIITNSSTGAGCYGFVRRNYDGQTYYTYDSPNGTVSHPVYDAAVTSFAWGRCYLNGVPYSARTANW